MAHPSSRDNRGKSVAQRELFEIDGNTGRATWNFDTTGIFLELVRNEKLAGNYGGKKSLNTQGYKNMCKNLFERTGTILKQRQINSKFESLRKDFRTWLDLINNTTGLGWDHAIERIAANDAWWNRMIAVIYVLISHLTFFLQSFM